MFVHGLWLLPSSWDRWAKFFDEAGYTALTRGWPDDPETVAEANARLISGEKDNTVPWAITNASFKRQKRNAAVTEIVEMPNRGHALTIDNGWREVAATALTFVKRFV